MGSEVGANMLAVGVLAVIFAASWFTYHQIEVRGQQLGKRILARLDSPEAYPLAGVK